MPNNKYLRSVRRERQIVNEFDKKGVLLAGRMAGSKSKGKFKTDVVVVDHMDKVIKLIQVKTKKNGRFLVMKDEEILGAYTLITSTWTWS